MQPTVASMTKCHKVKWAVVVLIIIDVMHVQLFAVFFSVAKQTASPLPLSDRFTQAMAKLPWIWRLAVTMNVAPVIFAFNALAVVYAGTNP